MNIIMAIAALCTLSTGDPAIVTEAHQIDCHKYYVKCLTKGKGNWTQKYSAPRIRKCMENR